MAVGSSNSFDLVVLGAGTGGYTAAFRAGQLGLKVALVDVHKIGGTCLHVGCIPTKAMLESADLYARVKKAQDFGITTGETSVDFAVIAKRRDGVVDRLTKGLMSLVKKNQVEFIRGRGKLNGGKKVEVDLVDDDGSAGGPPDARRDRHHPGHRQPRQVAARPRARRQVHRHQRRHPRVDQPSDQPDRRRRRGGRRRVRQLLRGRGRQGHASSSICPTSCRSRTARCPSSWNAPSSAVASTSSPAPAST